MQSIFQHRRLRRRLLLEYRSTHEKLVVLSNSTQDSGTSSLSNALPNSSHDVEKSIASNDDIQIAGVVSIVPPDACAHLDDSTPSRPGSSRRDLALASGLDGVTVRDCSASETDQEKVFLVEAGKNDGDFNPRNWSKSYRIWATFLVYLHGSIVGIASSIDSAALTTPTNDLSWDEIMQSLTIGIFLIGFGFGALFAGPLSEKRGRNPVFIGGWSLYALCITASSLAPNIGFRLTFRFLAGFFGSVPLTLGGASIGDLWSLEDRVYTFPVFANAAIMGPVIGPVIGGYIGAQTGHSWRWTEWTDLCFAGCVLILIILTQRETFGPIFVEWKAKYLQALADNHRYQTERSLSQKPIISWLKGILSRPFIITATEPILIFLTLWLTLIWIIMFTFLSGDEYMFRSIGLYGSFHGVIALCFMGMAVGLVLSSATIPLVAARIRRDLRRSRLEGLSVAAPECRLWYAMVSAPVVPVSLFWLAYTDAESISIWVPLVGSVLLAYGMLGVFTGSCEYIVHTYGHIAPAALAFNTFTRYLVAGVVVIAAPSMWRILGVQWSLTMWGCISAVLVPVPYIFFKWGPRIRAKSQYACA